WSAIGILIDLDEAADDAAGLGIRVVDHRVDEGFGLVQVGAGSDGESIFLELVGMVEALDRWLTAHNIPRNHACVSATTGRGCVSGQSRGAESLALHQRFRPTRWIN